MRKFYESGWASVSGIVLIAAVFVAVLLIGQSSHRAAGGARRASACACCSDHGRLPRAVTALPGHRGAPVRIESGTHLSAWSVVPQGELRQVLGQGHGDCGTLHFEVSGGWVCSSEVQPVY